MSESFSFYSSRESINPSIIPQNIQINIFTKDTGHSKRRGYSTLPIISEIIEGSNKRYKREEESERVEAILPPKEERIERLKQKYESNHPRELNFTGLLFKEVRKTMGENSSLLFPFMNNEEHNDDTLTNVNSKASQTIEPALNLTVPSTKIKKSFSIQLRTAEVNIENASKLIEELKEQKEQFIRQIEEFKTRLKQSNEEYKKKCESNKTKTERSLTLQDELNVEKEKTKEITTRLTKQLERYEEQRRQMHKHIQQLKGNIRVFCRVKPIDTDKSSTISFPELLDNTSKTLTMLTIGKEQISYLFDCTFPPSSTQSQVFEEVAPFLQSSLDGENVCIFAYGQTGSGKTYTMEGPSNDELYTKGKLTETSGVLPRSAHYIFMETKRLEEKGYAFKILFSAIEVYNEDIRDMLEDKTLSLVSGKEGTEIKGLIEKETTDIEDIINLMKIASKCRKTGKTSMNERSSRSHSIYRIKIHVDNPNTIKKYTGMLNIIDLAGSERAAKDAVISKDEILLREAKYINQSLTTLGRVLTMLTDRRNTRRASIPYRESKLTRILQSSLQYESKTLMFVNICPSIENLNQSKESLRFASTASLAC